MNFEAFNFHPAVAAGITKAGFTTPTPIQCQAIPPIMNHQDVMGLAQTGTGKTAAFVLPILHRLLKKSPADQKSGGPRALIMTPTRELAEQIHQAIRELGPKTRLKSATVYGGVGIAPQIQKLKQTDIIVACPGRLLDHIGRRTVKLSRLEVLVIDEADQMFDMGFLPDIKRIIGNLPSRRQTMLFSATMPDTVRRLAREILHQPVTVQIGTTAPAETVSHALYPVSQHLKTALLLNMLENTPASSVLVFTRTKHRAVNLGKKLARAGHRSASLQGNLSQKQRQIAMDGFRDGTYKILVATDIAARGIDVTRVSHVINYDIPATPEAYIHRIGRTGRATRGGQAFTLITRDDKDMVQAIKRVIGSKVEQRTLATFNYDTPAARADKPAPPRQQQRRKPFKAVSGPRRPRATAG
ncbi:MAG: DEAD/DEAH box helicase [Desulfosudaceae bacterium]